MTIGAAAYRPLRTPAPAITAGLAFLLLYGGVFAGLAGDWWTDPDSGHGLLLFPLSLYLTWRTGLDPARRPQPATGLILIAVSVGMGFLGHLAAETFTQRAAMVGATIGLIVFAWGAHQARRWWLPICLVALSIPLPQVLLGTLALPLQLQASRLGAALLAARHVPVRLAGNVIMLPHRELFVTEACSGLRSITALLALGLLVGALWLKSSWTRAVLMIVVLPVAVLLNGIRVFISGFVIYYIDPGMTDTAHAWQGMATFFAAFIILATLGWALRQFERRSSGTPA